MGSCDPLLGLHSRHELFGKPSKIDGDTRLAEPEGHDYPWGEQPRKAKLSAPKNSRFSNRMILGRKFRLNHLAYAASENRRDTLGTFGEKHPIIAWNTLRLGEILEGVEKAGRRFTPEALAHVQPLQFKHVIVNGAYDFPEMRDAKA